MGDLVRTETTRGKFVTYGDALKVNKCQRWFRGFVADDYDLSDTARNGQQLQRLHSKLRLEEKGSFSRQKSNNTRTNIK